MQPSISVIIPTYNASRYVPEAVASALAQSLKPLEIIVIDDGSSDDTREVLRPYERSIRYIYQRNQGVSAARNRGLKEARGDFIAFLDADDVWHPEKLELQIEVLAKRPEIGSISTKRFDWPGSAPPAEHPNNIFASLALVSWEQLAVRNFLDTSSIVVRREILDAVGNFDIQLQGPEDHDLWLRIAAATTFAHLNIALTGYRQVPGSLSKQADRMLRDKYKMLQKQAKQPAWKGRFVLRRKAYSLVNYSCYHMYGEAGRYGSALRCLLRSVALYPWPYSGAEVTTPYARPKGVILTLLRWAGYRRIGKGA